MSLESELYQLLCQDKATYVLAEKSFSCHFTLLDLDPEDLEEEIEFLVEDFPDIFVTPDVTLHIMKQFEAYMQNPIPEYVMLESYISRQIKAALIQFLNASQGAESELVTSLLYSGSALFDPHLLSSSDFRFLSAQTVQTGANLLRDIPPERIFDVPESWQDSNQGMRWDNYTARFFGYWRDLYLEAAERQDVMLLATS